jgi:predicted MPP superfamily phosphohydrolase
LANEVVPLKELEAPHGTFFVTGNHEYYSGVEQWIEQVDRLGFTVLLNEHRVLQKGSARVVLAGVTDTGAERFLESHRSDPKKALAGTPSDAVKVLLAHQPKSVYRSVDTDCHLQMSGHTHGGQNIMWAWMVAMTQPFIRGLHWYTNGDRGTWVYVNSGTGYWGPPTRFGISSEITFLTLTRGPQSVIG